MSEQYRPGGMVAGNSLNQTAAQLRQADGIDRIKELLNSAIDHYQSQVSLVRSAIDRIVGPTLSDTNSKSVEPLRPPYQELSIYNLLNDLERAMRQMDEQLARIREQLP